MTKAIAIMVHGGVGAPLSRAGGCRRAARSGLRVLTRGGTALDAVVKASMILEDDGRFNAGIGSTPRMDGKTVEMDAAVMDSLGGIGAVAATQFPRNPIAVAQAVMTTPHIMLAGVGADRFAKRMGFEAHPGMHPKARERFERVRKRLVTAEGIPERWQGQDIKRIWNFPTRLGSVLPGGGGWECDTIGACAIDREGRFAAANSTGGASPMLLGRVGDSPLPGAGFWAGPKGAVAATGVGEEIIRCLLCRLVYGWIDEGMGPLDACLRGVEEMGSGTAVGLIALTKSGFGAADNRTMPIAFFQKEVDGRKGRRT